MIDGNQDSISDWSVDLNSAPVIGANRDGAWSDWSSWSACSADCDGGMQWRSRLCDNPQPMGEGSDCHGAEREGKTCNTHSCQGNCGPPDVVPTTSVLEHLFDISTLISDI